MGELRDYLSWHDDYERPGSSLHRRLQVVIRMARRAMDELPAGPIRVVSLCAGQGADIVGAAEAHRRAADLSGRLVELEHANVVQARERIAALELALEVVEQDASTSDAYQGAVPADLVLACGIFGNISPEDIERTVRFLPSLCAPDARILWTRHARDPELLASVRGWFVEAGMEPVEMEIAEDSSYGVGMNRLVEEPPAFEAGQKLFTFTR